VKTLLPVVLVLCACKGGNDYASMAKKANAERGKPDDSEVKPAPANATLLSSGQNAPSHLQLEGDSVVWLNEGGRMGKPGLFKVGRGGGPTTAVLEKAEIATMSADGTSLYFLAPHEGKIQKVARGGGAPETLAETTSILRGLVIDDTDVIWAENEAIMRIPKAGGKPSPVVVVGIPDYLALDGNFVYWYSNIAGVISKAPKKAGGASKVYADDQHTLHTFFIDGNDLFVSFGAENKMVIQRLPKTGGKPVTLIDGQEPANDFAIDGSNIYWITEDNIFKVPRTGGAATKVVEKLEHGRDVVVDDQFVYWSDRSGRIEKMAK
jgi:hypothetical protein